MKYLNLLYIIIFFVACNSQKKNVNKLFTHLDSKETGLSFKNQLKPSDSLNMLKYMYYYNGAGVGAADFNNDSLVDLFFASNQGENKLYINKGNLKFEDITGQAQIPNVGNWSNGVTVVDINNDGKKDIYVTCVSGFRNLKGKNQLLVCTSIENGIPKYTDSAASYGLDFAYFGTQSAFFDADLDGDLDMFLLNHNVNHNGNYAPRRIFENQLDSNSGDKFLVNENGKFIDKTKTSGINSTKVGYGLGICIGDVNVDGYPDIYIGNDFHENDYLYINQKNGTFKEQINEQMMHTSQFTMGVDIADVNNDALPDVFSVDMLPEDPQILKRSLAEDEYNTFQEKLRFGYNYQYARNALQLNRGNDAFSETAYYSGIYATDWSWSCLFADFNNDAKKDLFVSNGIPKRLNDIDYVNFIGNEIIQTKIQNGTLDDKEKSIIDGFPEIRLKNKFFINDGKLKFTDISNDIEKSPNTFSNGAVYADFDNDGDLDVVTSNINDEVSFYKNLSENTNPYLSLNLKGSKNNNDAVGAKVFVFSSDTILSNEYFPTRGFMSCSSTPLHIGLGNTKPDSIFLVWPDNTYQKLELDKKGKLSISYREGLPKFNFNILKPKFKGYKIIDITNDTKIDFTHKENNFNEFNREPLIPRMNSTEGPAACVGDINNDGLDDIFFGSSRDTKSQTYIQNTNGSFSLLKQPDLYADSLIEIIDAKLNDVNKDGFLDLLLIGGGNEFYLAEPNTQPKLYLNNGKGVFLAKPNSFPKVTGTLQTINCIDTDNDGNDEVFIGAKCTPFDYGKPQGAYLFSFDKNRTQFNDVTKTIMPDLEQESFITSSNTFDIDGDKKSELILTKEWGGIVAYNFHNTNFKRVEITNLKGWWNFSLPIDIDKDGDIDILAGNQGLNTRVNPTTKQPLKMYYADFDKNSKNDQFLTYYQGNKEIPLLTKMDLEKSIPLMRKKYLYAADFSNANLSNFFGNGSLSASQQYTAEYFGSAIFINDGKGNFTMKELPYYAQLSPMRCAVEADLNGDDKKDILSFGNFYAQCMQLNRNDADFGTSIFNDGNNNFTASSLNGLVIKNQVRKALPIKIKNTNAYLLVKNNDKAMVVAVNK